MRIAILSESPTLYSTQRLKEAAEAQGHEVDVINTMRCYMDINRNNPTVRYKGQPLPHYDAVIPRIGTSVTFYGTAVVRQLESMGVFCVNESVAISRSRDKLRALQLLARKGIGIPDTGFAREPHTKEDVIKNVGGAPVVVKLLQGTQGIGVVLAETQKAAESLIEAFMGLRVNIMVQSFVKESAGADIRCFVVGGKVVAAMKRQAPVGEFRSSKRTGGTAEAVRLTTEERKTAILAAKTIGLSMCGVDILRSASGPLVLEVNASPDLKGIEKATGKDVARNVIDYIERSVKAK